MGVGCCVEGFCIARVMIELLDHRPRPNVGVDGTFKVDPLTNFQVLIIFVISLPKKERRDMFSFLLDTKSSKDIVDDSEIHSHSSIQNDSYP